MLLGMAPCGCAQYDLAGHTDGTPVTPISSRRELLLISCRSPSQQSAISEQHAFRELHTTHLPSSSHTVVQQSAISEQPAFRKLHNKHLPSSPHTIVQHLAINEQPAFRKMHTYTCLRRRTPSYKSLTSHRTQLQHVSELDHTQASRPLQLTQFEPSP